MEQIDFTYKFTFPDGKVKDIHFHLEDADGINASDACEAFVDFMKSAGFTEWQVERYFKD